MWSFRGCPEDPLSAISANASGEVEVDLRGASSLATTPVAFVPGIVFSDDVCGAAIRQYSDGNTGSHTLKLIEGVDESVGIVSVFGTRTPVHVEDGGAGALNQLVAGASKVYYAYSRSTSSPSCRSESTGPSSR